MKTLQTILILLMLGMIGFTTYHVFYVTKPLGLELYVSLSIQAIAFLFGLHTLWLVNKDRK